MVRFRPILVLVGVLAIAGAGAARADVKAGVEAWSAGDFARAVAEWRGPAAQGDPDAMFNLAQAYRLGRGVPEDLRQAEALYARAAAKGHLKAADNYGLLLFEGGRRSQALPYIVAAAERGDPRAQYLAGIAHFNGDLLPKDWPKAYALLTLANAAGLPQAAPAIRQMDEFVPLAQRQQAQLLAARMRVEADARRTAQMTAADLGEGPALASAAPAAVPIQSGRIPRQVASIAVPPSIAAAEAAVAEAMRATGTESPATAGADFARPAVPVAAPSARPVRSVAVTTPKQTTRPPPTPVVTSAGGPWKVQLGAFSVPGNADRLWDEVARKAVLAGKMRQTHAAGRLTRLLAAGWPTQSAAQSACSALKAAGHVCVVTR